MDISRELESRAELRLCCDCPSVLGELTPNEIQIVRKSDTQPMAPQGHKVDFALAEFISYFGAKQIPVATHIGQHKSRLPKIKRPVCQAHGETPKCHSQCLRVIIAQRQAPEGCSHLQGREEITIPAKKFPATESSRGLAFGAGGGEKPGGIAECQRLPRAQRVMVAQCKSTRPEGRDWARRSS